MGACIIGQSEPHTNHSYEKITVPMYVCMYCDYVCSDMSSTWQCARAYCILVKIVNIDCMVKVTG